MLPADKGFQLNALDPNSVGDLKRLARENPNAPATLRAAAKQFEAMLMQMVMKSMRQTSLGPGLGESDQTKTYQSLLDQQTALNMAHGNNNGLSEALYRQLGGLNGKSAVTDPGAGVMEGAAPAAQIFDMSRVIRQPANGAAAARADAAALAGQAAAPPSSSMQRLDRAGQTALESAQIGAAARQAKEIAAGQGGSERARQFVNDIWPHAEEASRRTGIPPQFMVAQAALETGWGDKVLRHTDGRTSYNLFNIKAGARWEGETVGRNVKEYKGDTAYTEAAQFRSYGSYAEAFRDYANLLSRSERYTDVLGQRTPEGFAHSLQKAGFATDPMYADKITRIIGGNTLRSALVS